MNPFHSLVSAIDGIIVGLVVSALLIVGLLLVLGVIP
jgi:hypothetical protein